MFDSAVTDRREYSEAPSQPARVVVALRERKTGRIYRGEAHEMHADLRVREGLGPRTEG